MTTKTDKPKKTKKDDHIIETDVPMEIIHATIEDAESQSLDDEDCDKFCSPAELYEDCLIIPGPDGYETIHFNEPICPCSGFGFMYITVAYDKKDDKWTYSPCDHEHETFGARSLAEFKFLLTNHLKEAKFKRDMEV
jgi:hypothetical protein